LPQRGMPVDASAARVIHHADDLLHSKAHRAFGGQVGAAFLTAVVASGALYRYGDPSAGSVMQGLAGHEAGLSGLTYGERVMATYRRRLGNGATLLRQAGDYVMERGGLGKAAACHRIKKRLDCQASGCVWDTAKGCLGIEEELEMSLKLQDERKQERRRREERQRREQEEKSAKRRREVEAAEAKAKQELKEREAKRRSAAEASACEDASMQRRSDCKANPKCVYDTARGCYTKPDGQARDNVARGGHTDKAAANKEPAAGGVKCEDAAMQRRKDCKANPGCIYDTALGCYTRK